MTTTTEINIALDKLSRLGKIAWKNEIYKAYGDSKSSTADKAIASILKYTLKNQCVTHYGIRFVPGSITSVAAQVVPDMLPSDSAQVFAVLKANKRIMQVGGGKGKGVAVFSADNITDDAETSVDIDLSDPASLLKQLKTVIVSGSEDLKILQAKIEEQQAIINVQQQSITNLESMVEDASRGSWY